MINPGHSGSPSQWCTFVRERLELFLDGELYGTENLSFVTHLKECEECAAHWADDEKISRRLMVAFGDVAAEALVDAARTSARKQSNGGVFGAPRDRELRRRLPALAGIVALVALVVGGALYVESRVTIEDKRIPAMADASMRVLLARGRALARDDDRMPWRAADRGDVIRAGMELAASEDAELVVGLGDSGSVLLTAGAQMKVSSTGLAGDDLALDLSAGQATGDITGRSFVVRSGELNVTGWSAAFTVAVPPAEAGAPFAPQAWVTRGSVTARWSLGTRTVSAGQLLDMQSGLVVAGTPSLGVLAGGSDAQRMRLEDRLEKALVENRSLRVQLARAEAESKREVAAPEGDRETPDVIVRTYLETVELSNHVEIDPPNGYARTAMAKLEAYGSDVVLVLSDALAREESEQKRIALLGLIHGTGGPEAAELLKKSCFDRSVQVRETAIWLLMKLDDRQLVEHFLLIWRSDESPGLRVRAAFAAAKLGSEIGFDGLVATYYETKDYCVRSQALSSLLKLDAQPAVTAFIHRVLRDWTASDSSFALRMIVRRVDELKDAEALPLLRDLQDRQGVPTEVKRLIDEAVDRMAVN